MLNMKTTSVRDVQHNLRKILLWVENGEEVLIMRRKEVVAKLVPPGPKKIKSPDFLDRAKRVWGEAPRGKPLSDLASDARGDR
jgi:antitoxin (DNA-binding transcriptional repressor) of toxin-antitoxin stability system